jgi:hypothetical protein
LVPENKAVWPTYCTTAPRGTRMAASLGNQAQEGEEPLTATRVVFRGPLAGPLRPVVADIETLQHVAAFARRALYGTTKLQKSD